MKEQFYFNIAGTFNCNAFVDEVSVIPDSATLTVYYPSSMNKLIETQVMAIDGSGNLSYELLDSDNQLPAINYKAQIDFTYSGVTYSNTYFYDVVYTRLVNTLNDYDLLSELPTLRDNGFKFRGTSDSATITSITDSNLKRFKNDYFNGGSVLILSTGETRNISDFDSTTGTVSFDAVPVAPISDPYILTKSYKDVRERALEVIEGELIKDGKRAHLLIDSYDFRLTHLYLTITMICKSLSTSENDIWWTLWKEYEKKAWLNFSTVTVMTHSSYLETELNNLTIRSVRR